MWSLIRGKRCEARLLQKNRGRCRCHEEISDLKIVVEGHTDNVGGEKYNINLSQKRAEAIKEVMVKKFNIEASRITAKGFGFSNPLADNSTKEGRQQNRRVEAAVEYTVKK